MACGVLMVEGISTTKIFYKQHEATYMWKFCYSSSCYYTHSSSLDHILHTTMCLLVTHYHVSSCNKIKFRKCINMCMEFLQIHIYAHLWANQHYKTIRKCSVVNLCWMFIKFMYRWRFHFHHFLIQTQNLQHIQFIVMYL